MDSTSDSERWSCENVSENGIVGLDAVAQRHRRVMKVLRDDTHAVHLVRSLAEFFEGDRGWKLTDFDREVGELHLAGKHFTQRTRASLRTADADPVSGDEQWNEEGEALDMIPVRVTEQDGRRDRTGGAGHQR